ncbi:MAG: insulinase family protein [Spirochaetota bacterium]|nr:insulinase family protein [Spirochaetota bacterium]
MKRFNLFIFGLLLLFSVQSGIYSSETDDPTLKRVVLDNGMVVILKEKRDVPMVAMQVWVKAGSITETNNMGSGLSHYFEHMLGKRTKIRKTEQFYNDIRRMGGSDANAYTSYDRTVYHFTIQSEYVNEGIEAISDIMQNSVFDDKESEKEIQVILKEINMGDDSPGRYLWKLFMQTIFTTHPYRHPVIGYRHLFKSLTKEDMLNYYRSMYSPNNMILVLVGDFDKNLVLEKVKTSFKDFKRKKLPPIYIPKEPLQRGFREEVREFHVNTAKVVMGYPSADALSDDVATLDVLAIILGQGETSRFYKRLKDREQLVNSIEASSWTPKDIGIFEIGIDLEEKNLAKVFKIINSEIEEIKRNGVSEKELKRAKQKVQVGAVFKMQTLGGYARSLAYGEFLGNIHYEKYYLDAVNHVTNNDIKRIANKYLKKERLNIATLVPKNDKKKLTKLETVSKNKKGKVEKIILRNGLTLLLKEDRTLPLVGINATFNGGYRYENVKNQGIYNLLTSTLLKGTNNKSAQQIAETIEDTGGSLSADSGLNFISMEGVFLKKDFHTGFKLLLESISNANFPEKEIEKEKKTILSDIKKRDDDIWRASRYHMRRVRFKGHPYSFDGIGTKESIKSIKRNDLLKLYKEVITPKNMVLAIFGDINKKEIIKLLLEKSSFSLRKTKLAKVNKIPKLLNVNQETFYTKEKRRQSIIKILFDVPGYYSEDKYPFILLTHIFSGIGSRLFLDLRGKRTLAYATGGFYEPRVDTGLFLFYIGTEPSKKDEAIKGLFEHIKRIKTELISKRELEIAKNSAIGPIIKRLQSLNGQASIQASNEKLKLGYDYHLKLIENLKKVTREDIKRVADRYFTLDRYVLSIVESKIK